MATAAVAFFSAASSSAAAATAASAAATMGGAAIGGTSIFSASALAAGAATLTSASSIASILSGAFTAVGALSNIASGKASQAALDQQAIMTDMQAKQELLKGQKDHVDALTELNDVLAHNIAGGFARGLTGSGSVSQASLDAIKKSEFEVDIDRGSSEIRAGAKRMQANQFRIEGVAKKTAGQTAAIVGIGEHVFRASERGDV